MTGPQHREPRDPPDGWMALSIILCLLMGGAIAALSIAFLSAFGLPHRP